VVVVVVGISGFVDVGLGAGFLCCFVALCVVDAGLVLVVDGALGAGVGWLVVAGLALVVVLGLVVVVAGLLGAVVAGATCAADVAVCVEPAAEGG
jgi:hypothetical protein